MDEQIGLSAEVVVELRAHRKVNAIKLLRAEQAIGLKEAKDIIDAYMDEHLLSSNREPRKGGDSLFFIALAIVLAYGLYKYLT